MIRFLKTKFKREMILNADSPNIMSWIIFAAWFVLGPVLSWKVGFIWLRVITYYQYPSLFAPALCAQERLRDRGGEGGLKYDSHYGGYNLVAFFTDFMTAASYSRPIGARHRLQEEGAGEKGDWCGEKICSFQSALELSFTLKRS